MLCGLVPILVLGSGCGVIAGSPVAAPTPVSSTVAPVPSAWPATSLQTDRSQTTPASTAPTRSPVDSPGPTRSVTPSSTPARPPTPACSLPSSLLARDLTSIPGGARVVALTFDAGGSDDGVLPILKTLKERAAPATFFLTGHFTHAFPEASRTIAKQHPVGNHTENHRDLTKLAAGNVRAEIREGESSILKATGVNPRPYFRFPSGARNSTVIRIANAECYVPFRWTVDSLGWQGTEGGMSADKVHQRVVEGLQPGAIILMHVGANPDDGTTFDADALPRVIDSIRAHGYRLVTLEHALPAEP